MSYVDEAGTSHEPTAFRIKEKQYQLHKERPIRIKNGRRKSGKEVVRPTDVSDVLDVDILQACPCPHVVPGNPEMLGARVVRDSSESNSSSTYRSRPPGFRKYHFPGHPGFILVRNALGRDVQRSLIKECLTSYCEWPSRTNLIAHYSNIPSGLWEAAQKGLHYVAGGCGSSQPTTPPQWKAQGQLDSIPASNLLKKLRWATLGSPFNWTERQYEFDAPHVRELPTELVRHAVSLAGTADWKPDVALVNYYRPGDTLGGHRDDAEKNMEKPIVSFSLGCSAVFLMGGREKSCTPTAILVRSGDALILGGASRDCYHGVPRIFPDTCDLQSPSEQDDPFASYMRTCRINISLRQAAG